ncbi:MAG: MbnP family copper-binding protein [Myxococcota bacterium]
MRRATLPALGTLTLCTTVVASGCGEDQATFTNDVELRFAALAGGEPLRCGESYSVGDGNFEYRGLRFFISDVTIGSGTERQSLMLDDDGQWQDGRVALLDFEDGASECALGTTETRAVVQGQLEVPASDGDPGEAPTRGLAFTLGVPFEVNHQDVAQATGPVSLTSMFWNWQGGYKFLRLDGFAGGGPYNVHLGSTGCDGGPMGGVTACMNPNRVRVELPDFSSGEVVLLDIGALLESAPLSNTEMTPPGCMSAPNDPECGAVFSNFGLSYGGSEAGDQRIFSRMGPNALP